MALIRSLLVLVLCLSVGLAEDIYITDQTSGGDTGADCANAHSVAWLDTPANWGAGANKVSAGDTVHFCGTITNNVKIQNGGSPGNPITFLFESGCKFTRAAWGTAPELTANQTNDPIYFISAGGSVLSDFVIDGGANGIIENTDNGVGKTFTNNCIGVYLVSCATNVEVKNLNINNLYFRTQGTTNDIAGGQGVEMQGSMTNCSIHNCTVTMVGNGIVMYWSAGYSTNLQVYSNTVTFCSWGVAFAAQQANAICDQSYVWGNRLNHFENNSGNGNNHLDGIISFITLSSQWSTNLNIHKNWIGPDLATNQTTAAIFLNDLNSAGCPDGCLTSQHYIGPFIYNNKLEGSNVMGGWSDGYISAQGSPVRIWNNTVVSMGSGNAIKIDGGHIDCRNNLTRHVGTTFYLPYGLLTNSDYNVWSYDNDPNHGFGRQTNGGTWGWFNWITNSILGYTMDGNSSTNIPSLDANDVPTAGDTVARGHGTNLTSFGITTDFYGNARPASGAWVIGAFENTNNAADSAIIGVVPSSLNFGTLLTNTTSSLTFYVTNTGTAVLVGQATTSSPFSITSPSGGNYSVAVNASQTVTVKYSPTVAASDSGTVTCTGGGGATVSLSGSATNAPFFGVMTAIRGSTTIRGATTLH